MERIVTLCVLLTFCLAQDLSNPEGREGEVALIGGTAPGTGTIMIYHQGRWGKVCDDGWNLQAAHVVCKQLGFPRALMAATGSHFGGQLTEYEFWLDDVRCYGQETHIADCEHEPWGQDNCQHNENAGVFCFPPIDGNTVINPGRSSLNRFPQPSPKPSSTTTTTTTKTTTTTTTTIRPSTEKRRLAPTSPPTPEPTARAQQVQFGSRNDVISRLEDAVSDEANLMQRQRVPSGSKKHNRHHPTGYEMRLTNGRTANEGLIEVFVNGEWGVICGDNWDLMASMVVCQQTGFGYAHTSMQNTAFGGLDRKKLLSGIRCDGDEERLDECYHDHLQADVLCSKRESIANVICAHELPDLVPNATLIQESAYLQDRPMYYMQCALEENCAAKTAFTIRDTYRDWHIHRRRLLRFSSSTWNFGTAPFRPHASKQNWEWHLCHMHYHSMSVFAHYDLLDLNNNKVAEGHKASFCLEDVQCIPGKEKVYQCKGFGEQGISVGCADDYLHDIDCQWIDITEIPAGKYIFKMHINPEKQVAELDFNNNAVTCDLQYTGYDVNVSNCLLGKG